MKRLVQCSGSKGNRVAMEKKTRGSLKQHTVLNLCLICKNVRLLMFSNLRFCSFRWMNLTTTNFLCFKGSKQKKKQMFFQTIHHTRTARINQPQLTIILTFLILSHRTTIQDQHQFLYFAPIPLNVKCRRYNKLHTITFAQVLVIF